jgi:PKHD-type hydroxylase
MHFFYLLPSSIQSDPQGRIALDWNGRQPFHQKQEMEVNAAAPYPLIVPNLLTPEECAAVVALGESRDKSAATVNHRTDLESRDYRISEIAWIEPDPPAQWLFHRLAAAIAQANASYRFDLTGIAEALQFTCYGAGHYLGWHVDMADGETAARKLSLTIQLSNSDDYDGGDLQFHGGADMPVVRTLGTGIFFPGYLAHQVAPVTRGLRRCLVVWSHGPAFR